jgi:NTE family protein
MEVRMRKAVLALLVLAPLAGCTSVPSSAPSGGGQAHIESCPPDVRPPVCQAPARPYPFVNLVFEGGGVKGVAYAGALRVLEQQGVLPQVERVAGTSAGSITAALVTLGYTPDEIETLLLDLEFERFKDGSTLGGPERLFKDYGWFKGDYFLEWMQSRVQAKTGNPASTFADLGKDPRFRRLYVVSSDLSRRASQVFSLETSPDLPVAEAVRTSMSIPLFFEAVHVDDSLFGQQSAATDLFVDGGVFDNYPIGLFDGDGINGRTMGFFLDNLDAPNPDVSIDGFPEYVRNLFEAILRVQTNAFKNTPADVRRTAIINNLGVRTTDFGITDKLKCELMQQGAIAACNFLEHFSPAQP